MALILSITLLTIGAIATMDMSLGLDEATKYDLAKIFYGAKQASLSEEQLNKLAANDIGLKKMEDFLLKRHDSGMLVILLLLTVLLLMIIFYFGPRLAKDIRRVQLVVDSIDADDYFLVQQELETVTQETGSAELQDNEDEIVSLLKVVGATIPTKTDDLSFQEAELDNREASLQQKEDDLNQRDDELADKIVEMIATALPDNAPKTSIDSAEVKQIAEEVSVETIKRGVKSFFDITQRIIRDEISKLKE